MHIVQIEHPVSSFDAWKEAFDGDPLGREKSGVRSYRITRPVDDPNFVVGHLEFDDSSAAEAFAVALRELWGHLDVIGPNPRARVLEVVESKKY
jgi:hypothetical protein